jgi:hypothetical protein
LPGRPGLNGEVGPNGLYFNQIYGSLCTSRLLFLSCLSSKIQNNLAKQSSGELIGQKV